MTLQSTANRTTPVSRPAYCVSLFYCSLCLRRSMQTCKENTTTNVFKCDAENVDL